MHSISWGCPKYFATLIQFYCWSAHLASILSLDAKVMVKSFIIALLKISQNKRQILSIFRHILIIDPEGISRRLTCRTDIGQLMSDWCMHSNRKYEPPTCPIKFTWYHRPGLTQVQASIPTDTRSSNLTWCHRPRLTQVSGDSIRHAFQKTPDPAILPGATGQDWHRFWRQH